jgi:hypothetical protein
VKKILILAIILTMLSRSALAENKGVDLDKDLANPIASLVSVPSQLNFDENIGHNEEGSMIQLNIQPVLPFTLSEDWLLIYRS